MHFIDKVIFFTDKVNYFSMFERLKTNRLSKTKVISSLLIILATLFVAFEVFNASLASGIVKMLLLPMLILLYYKSVKQKSKCFLIFLILYSIPQIFDFISLELLKPSILLDNILYYVLNTFYIVAYIFLMFEMLKYMNVKLIINKYITYLIVLLALDVYCVMLVSDVTLKSGYFSDFGTHLMEFTYNIITMLLLTVALMNYMYKDSKKAMNLLLGSLCIVFSEVIQIAYFYVVDMEMLSVIYSVLLIIAFLFFHIQANLSGIGEEEVIESANVNQLEV